jgi:hypothetical protein
VREEKLLSWQEEVNESADAGVEGEKRLGFLFDEGENKLQFTVFCFKVKINSGC